jgi:hypothetical protein
MRYRWLDALLWLMLLISIVALFTVRMAYRQTMTQFNQVVNEHRRLLILQHDDAFRLLKLQHAVHFDQSLQRLHLHFPEPNDLL